MKRKSYRPLVNTRRSPPKIRKGDHGIQLLCPFCVPTHPIVPGQISACGTVVEVNAVQTIIPQRTVRDKNLTCMKCHEAGKGSMVPYMGQYVHFPDCRPEVLIVTQPNYSKNAERIFKMKDGWLKNLQIRLYGTPKPVEQVDEHGILTGKILGYVFPKA